MFNVHYVSVKKTDVEEKLFFDPRSSTSSVFSDKLKHKCTKSFNIQLDT